MRRTDLNTDNMAAKTVIEAAEIAAEFLYHLYDDLGASEEEGIEKASEIYEMISGKELDSESVLGV